MATRNLLLFMLFAGLIVFFFFFLSDDPGGEVTDPSRQRRSPGKVPASQAVDLQKAHHQGVSLIERHQFAKAEEALLPVVEAVPDGFVPLFNLAIAQLNQAEAGVDRAIQSLLRARELDATDPRVPYALGLIHRFKGDEEPALEEFRRAVELAPGDPEANYNVAVSLANLDQRSQALPYFEIAARLDPTLLGPLNNLQLIYRRAGRKDEADRILDQFKSLKESGRGRSTSTKYTEQGDLSLSIRDWNVPLPAKESVVPIAFDTPTWLRPEPRIAEQRLAPPAALVDLDLDCVPDLWVAGERGGVWSLRGETPIDRVVPEELAAATTFAVGDFDEDGVPDVATAVAGGVSLFSVDDRGDRAAGPAFTLQQRIELEDNGPIAELRWVDLDLEGDLDLLIIPEAGQPLIALNQGRAIRLADAPKLPWIGENAGEEVGGISQITVRDLDGDVDADFVFSTDSRSAIDSIVNAPEWNFSLGEGSIAEGGSDQLLLATAIVDLDGDVLDDLVVLRRVGGEDQILWARGVEVVKAEADQPASSFFASTLEPLIVKYGDETSPAPGTARTLHFDDFDLDGKVDFALSAASVGESTTPGPLRTWILKGDGAGRFELVSTIEAPAKEFVSGDLDGDFDPDLIVLSPGGAPIFVRNVTNPLEGTPTPYHAFRLYLGGARDGEDRRTNLLGYGTRLELRAGDLVSARTFEGALGSRSQGLAPMIFGIGPRDEADWVYLRWSDGVSQSENQLPLDSCHQIEEVQRKSSSCPVLFCWDGTSYRFITDFMGGGGLGFWIGPGEFATPEPTEVVRIAPDALQPIEGEYRLSVMEPMQEACYIDQLTLLAVDHPNGTEVYPLEYFPVKGAKPSGVPLLVNSIARSFPLEVTVGGNRVDPACLASVDRQYAGPSLIDPDLVGYATRTEWVLSFPTFQIERASVQAEKGEDDPVYLFLDGWVEYPYSRINFAAWQRDESIADRRLEAPSFWWDRGDGDWQLIGREIGYPAGMPKTMVLEVTEAVTQGAKRFRIESNLEVYWDRVFLASATVVSSDRVKRVELKSAELRFGGYPREYSDDGSLPATYHYQERDATLGYLPMGGNITRYGRVEELLTTVDDQFVILGGGDELELIYDVNSLPELTSPQIRTFLLDTHGYCKDRDPLTAAASSVEPLPFGSMTKYPPAVDDREPNRRLYRQNWNTRRD